MRLYLYFLILMTPLATFSAQTHLDIRNCSLISSSLKGPVKRITEEYNYELSDKKYWEIRDYDEQGNLTHRTKWDYKDKITYTVTNSYNEAGSFIRQQVEDLRKKTANDYEIILSPATRQIAYKCRLTGEIEVVSYDEDKYKMGGTVKKKGKSRSILWTSS